MSRVASVKRSRAGGGVGGSSAATAIAAARPPSTATATTTFSSTSLTTPSPAPSLYARTQAVRQPAKRYARLPGSCRECDVGTAQVLRMRLLNGRPRARTTAGVASTRGRACHGRCARVSPSRLRHNRDARWHTSCLFLCGMATPTPATRSQPSERHAAGLVMCRARNTPQTRALMVARKAAAGLASHAGPRRSRWTALMVGLAVLLTTQRAAAATLTRGPLLQLLTTHSVTVVWYMTGPARCGLAVTGPNGATTVLAGNTAAVCVVPVEGLSPGTSYVYSALADDLALHPESVFRTDDPRAPFSFLVVGDTASGSSGQ